MEQGKRINLNNDWKYAKIFQEEMIASDYDASGMEYVRLPHTNQELPYNYINVQDYEMVSCYRRELTLQEEDQGKVFLLTFMGAAHEATVYVNGQEAAVHHCGYTAFTVDITSFVRFDCANVVAVRLDSRESLNQPPFGHVIDYMTYGGLYREVYLEVKNPVYIEDVYVRAGADCLMKYEITVADDREKWSQGIEEDFYIELELMSQEGISAKKIGKLQLSKENQKAEEKNHPSEELKIQNHHEKRCSQYTGECRVEDAQLWTMENPVLYSFKATLHATTKNEQKEATGNVGDSKTVRFGFRDAEFRADGFYLNGVQVKLRGANRHQSYPYVGYAMPESVQNLDADILKNELGMNAVRTSHYPQSQHFLNRCDEIGLLVFTEIPGWQHLGDDVWKNIVCENVKEMVIQNRNHPSIILWGVRVNESQDDDELYKKTNAIAHELDQSRSTGGVRYLKKSSLLEDVYTYNDFLFDGETNPIEKKSDITTDMKKAYLISEYNGHMFPTKMFDDEEHRSEHALRHAKVLHAVRQSEDVAGAFAWCMFDYNTHKDFGSGDSICYHGMMDMFRNPKLAAAPYACYGKETVLEISSSMDIGEHPAGRVGEIYFYSNADSVRIYKNGEFIKEYPANPYEPVLIDDLIGERIEREEGYSHKKAEAVKKVLAAVTKYGMYHLPLDVKLAAAKLMVFHHMKFQDAYALYGKYVGDWGNVARSYRFEAVRNGKVVKTVVKEPVQSVHLHVEVSKTHLQEKETYDVAAVRMTARDQNENVLPFYNEPISLSVSGEIELIGPSVTTLRGGCGGTYIKTTGHSGEGKLTITGANGEMVELEFMVCAD